MQDKSGRSHKPYVCLSSGQDHCHGAILFAWINCLDKPVVHETTCSISVFVHIDPSIDLLILHIIIALS